MMLSSGDPPDRITRCEQLGISTYLTKPVKQSELFDAIMLAIGVTAVEDEPEIPLSQQRGLESLRILLAEDSLVNQKLAVALLEREGHSVVVAGNGREAVDVYDPWQFDLILMDVQMPEMDGFEATAAIRSKQEKADRRVPIIAMTAHALKGDRERCLEAGMDDYVAKPIKARLLFDTMVAALAMSGSHQTQTPAPPPQADRFSWTKALDTMEGDDELRKIVMEAAVKELPKSMSAVRQALADNDAGALWRAAHKLAGAVRYFGDTPAHAIALALEMMGKNGDLEPANEVLAPLEANVKDLLAIISASLASGRET
jgi:CheY-like chemotaxis protein